SSMARQSFATEAFSPADPKTVFDVLADVPRWREWAGPMIRQSMYERQGSPEAGGVGAIRKLGAPPVWGREEIVEYEPPHHLAYVMLSGHPIRNYRADVDLSPPGRGRRIHWPSTCDPL